MFNQMFSAQPAPTRAGNSLVVALGILTAAAAVITLSTISLGSSYQTLVRTPMQLNAVGAAEAVALLKEKTLVDLATSGDPAAFNNFTSNYGETFIGDARVRWRIEPAIVAGVAAKTVTNGWGYITNPDSDPTGTPTAPRLANDYTYLYRIAAEAQILDGQGEPLARAQTVKFAAVDKQPLFRYVIFYAKQGPKGDLEFNHGPGITIKGNVHSNGAIYLGGAPTVNDWGSLKNGSSASDATKLGKDDSVAGNIRDVRVTGVDGIFRLNKSILYSAFNQLPMESVSPSGWTDRNAAYVLTANSGGVPFPGEAGTTPRFRTPNTAAGTDVYGFTWNGTVINPNRIKDAAGLHTLPKTGNDVLRTINDRHILGADDSVTLAKANDSRDKGGRSGFVWKTASMGATPGFSGYARTEENGGGVIRVSPLLANRPMEAQDLAYPVDNPATEVDESEQHEIAQPKFIVNGAATTAMPVSGAAVIEVPGAYLGYALGDAGTFLTRAGSSLSTFTGWTATNRTGVSVTTLPTAGVGLIIRERPRPDGTIYPKNETDVADPNSKDYLPYAYGKHARPTTMPFTAMTISDNIRTYPSESFNAPGANADPFTRHDVTTLNQMESYSAGGILTARSACAAGPATSTNQDDASSQYTHNQNYYRENWRFFHFGASSSTGTAGGLTASYFNNNGWSGDPFVQNDATIDFDWGNGAPSGTGLSTDWFSVRWEGEVAVPTTGSWTFGAWADDVCRVWINHQLVINQTNYIGGYGNPASFSTAAPRTMEAGKKYPIVVEMSEQSGGAGCKLAWTGPSGTAVIIPSSNLYPRKAIPVGVTAVSKVAFNRSKFSSVQMRISNLNGGSALSTSPAKVGLMIRDASGGVPELLNGRDRYVSLLFSPTRGVFTQARLQPSKIFPATGNVFFVGNSSTPVADSVGQIPNDPSVDATVVRSGTLTTSLSSSGASVNDPITQEWVSGPSTSWAAAGYAANPFSVAEGAADKVYIGPVTGTTSGKTHARPTYRTWTRDWDFDLNLGTCPQAGQRFISIDEGKNIRLYNSTTGTASGWNGTIKWMSSTKVRFTAVNNNGSTWTADKPLSITGTANGTNKTFYRPYPSIYNGGVKVKTLTAAETKAALETKYGGTYTDGGVNFDSFAKPILTAVYDSVGAPGAVTAPTGPAIGTYTFSISRARIIEMDLNSFISAAGYWFNAAASPWVTGMPYLPALNLRTPSNWTGTNVFSPTAISATARTGGYRPDQWALNPTTFAWNYSTQPGIASTASSIVNTRKADGTSGAPGVRWVDDYPIATNGSGMLSGAVSATNPLWLRIEKSSASSTKVKFKYAFSVNAPATWNTLRKPDNVTDIEVDLATFGAQFTPAPSGSAADLLIGLCMQSGDKALPLDATVDNITINTTHASPDDVIDATDWDGGTVVNANDWSKYLASQYQVFWGPFDITEDFFTYNQNVAGGRNASEEWIYNTREFWSQGPKWLNGSDKDAVLLPATAMPRSNRELWAKATLLSLDMRNTQDYIRARTLDNAVIKRITNPAGLAPVGTPTSVLQASFNGLFYTARTNRYPSNPNVSGASGGGTSGANPYNFYLPNVQTGSPEVSLHNISSGITGLQPYSTAVVPYATPIKPQEFMHGVRIVRGSKIDWNRPAAGVPTFGNSKTSIVTPNQLFIQGSLNYTGGTWDSVNWRGSSVTDKPIPMAIMGDQVTLLSNSWSDNNFQQPGIQVDGTSVVNGGTLKFGTSANTLPVASETWYYTSILTNNQPTNKDSVVRGEAASIINTMVFLEGWANKNMNYKGSLVVLDTRRYTENYLLEAPKNAGLCPFGYTVSSSMSTTLKNNWLAKWGKSSADWGSAIPGVQGAPDRKLQFNYDLLTEQGTPPFTPFGVSVAGKGGWTQVIK